MSICLESSVITQLGRLSSLEIINYVLNRTRNVVLNKNNSQCSCESSNDLINILTLNTLIQLYGKVAKLKLSKAEVVGELCNELTSAINIQSKCVQNIYIKFNEV